MPAAEFARSLDNGFQRPVTNGRSTANGVVEDPFKLSSEYAYTPRKIKVITIGAGFSGLLMAHKFQHRRFLLTPTQIGRASYASGPDILAGISTAIFTSTPTVVDAIWQEDSGQWQVTVEHEGVRRVEHCHVLISAQGVLVHESWPEVPGLRDFKGHLTHSAAWEHNYDYAGKRIAVIGNGSSGIQIVPQMAKLPGTDVKNFIRGPAWVYYRAPPSKHLGRDDPDPNPRYTDDERKRFRDPDFHLQHRKGIISRTNKADKIGHDPELCATLIPTWELGCRRITPGPGYLESFLRPNCSVTNSGITRVAENGVHTADGKFYECDVIVCATGFDVSHRPRYPVIGKSKIDLATRWAEEPDSYLSVAVPDFPNYFMMMGPNCLGGHGSLVESLNWTGDYFVKWIRKMATEDIRYVTPKQAVADAFMRYGDEVHKTLVWTGACKSWYKRNRVDGRVTALFGGSAHLFNRMLGDIRGEDFDVTYNTANPFRFMGNGFTEWEMDPKSDLSWYVEKAEVPYEEGGKSQ
ncbi:phenylacetone monooxygenase [Verticillium dahliae]|nr:phenylacetone monooxygenase [Verticillium dahliae]